MLFWEVFEKFDFESYKNFQLVSKTGKKTRENSYIKWFHTENKSSVSDLFLETY